MYADAGALAPAHVAGEERGLPLLTPLSRGEYLGHGQRELGPGAEADVLWRAMLYRQGKGLRSELGILAHECLCVCKGAAREWSSGGPGFGWRHAHADTGPIDHEADAAETPGCRSVTGRQVKIVLFRRQAEQAKVQTATGANANHG
jgi:hypothetical protein